jgi:hypothetical protein
LASGQWFVLHVCCLLQAIVVVAASAAAAADSAAASDFEHSWHKLMLPQLQTPPLLPLSMVDRCLFDCRAGAYCLSTLLYVTQVRQHCCVAVATVANAVLVEEVVLYNTTGHSIAQHDRAQHSMAMQLSPIFTYC